MMFLANPGRAWSSYCFPGESAQDWEGTANATQPSHPVVLPKCSGNGLALPSAPRDQLSAAALMSLFGSPSSELVG